MGEPHATTHPPHWNRTADTGRRPLLCRLPAAPAAESGRLSRLLELLPAGALGWLLAWRLPAATARDEHYRR